jgi:hypothetical protein
MSLFVRIMGRKMDTKEIFALGGEYNEREWDTQRLERTAYRTRRASALFSSPPLSEK